MLQSLMTVTVARRVMETDEIVVLTLVNPDGGDLPPFSAGSHVDIEVMPGLMRQYSLCNSPLDRSSYTIGVLREPNGRGGSAAVHDLAEGTQVRISEPRNHFGLEPSAGRSVLLAGGIGVTPILCMAERLSNTGADFDMHYCTRAADKTAFRARIAASPYAGQVHFHFDDGPDEQKLDIDTALGEPLPDTHVYVCGPPGFIDFVIAAGKARGFAEANLHREYFTVGTDQGLAEGGPFQIRLASSGQILDVPADRSVVQVLADAGIDVPVSCEQGVCGTCMTYVLEGVPDHRDYYLTEAEREKGDQFTPCCSRSKTPMLVLDL